uniref:small ubiquitin-related modifier 2-like n=1 Tax=Erigeron canadensis TaxID=72917 RepID=UPI001CB989D5|nr:small ubiquitin-related modifier 2-like [Erigeron canadensis]
MANVPQPAGKIVVVVKDQHNAKLLFKIKREVPIKKVMVAYCKKKHVDYNLVTFLLDGTRVSPNQTPKQLKLSNCAEITVVSSMIGGGYL